MEFLSRIKLALHEHSLILSRIYAKSIVSVDIYPSFPSVKPACPCLPTGRGRQESKDSSNYSPLPHLNPSLNHCVFRQEPLGSSNSLQIVNCKLHSFPKVLSLYVILRYTRRISSPICLYLSSFSFSLPLPRFTLSAIVCFMDIFIHNRI